VLIYFTKINENCILRSFYKKNMKKFFAITVLTVFTFTFFGCPSDDEVVETILPRPFAEVYQEDIAEIEGFLQTHEYSSDANFNVSFEKISSTNPGTPIIDELDNSANQDDDTKKLKFLTLRQNDIDYKVYYLKLATGTQSKPYTTRLDSIFMAYKGQTFDLKTFDIAVNPIWFQQVNFNRGVQTNAIVEGLSRVLTKFKSGVINTSPNPDGTLSYSDFGSGVIFIPSGLAYFNLAQSTIPAYSPIIFAFKLAATRKRDHDGDKIFSDDEFGDLNELLGKDTDGDGFLDFIDQDDDNDGKLTKDEIKIPSTNPTQYYSFVNIPLCSGGNGKKKHLDPACN
jgi:FKBP-type peptidyl-prolyl cis-trans isomerase FkpA